MSVLYKCVTSSLLCTLLNNLTYCSSRFVPCRESVRENTRQLFTATCSVCFSPKMSPTVKQFYDYFLVLDFEATCEKHQKIYPQEIIEFPVLKINANTLTEESVFHQYVQPMVHKELTTFCTELTGIIQDTVDGQPDIIETLHRFDEWMKKEGLLNKKTLFVTCGDWDLNVMLPGQCQYFNLTVPNYMKSWANLKQVFVKETGIYPKGIQAMLQHLGLKHYGRLHSGIDDCRNIASILGTLVQRGVVVQATKQLASSSGGQSVEK